jgi:hypothetical protein
MTLMELSSALGNVLNELDRALQTPGLSDADWQSLYALRKHLDDQQRSLVAEQIDDENASFQDLTSQLKVASAQLTQVIGDINKVEQTIGLLSQIASYGDKILSLVG